MRDPQTAAALDAEATYELHLKAGYGEAAAGEAARAKAEARLRRELPA